ncbi:hypothetical protein LSCM4_03177 [Leishmania orientalis]|uniref:Uncharacterized protein n=1 Tax=Leishmania orientalis TaxID=2249476 RepID=A0A836H622_9TRYP|nr:hypothetical protein LSCM4_03177 [Leishmania orientalis]
MSRTGAFLLTLAVVGSSCRCYHLPSLRSYCSLFARVRTNVTAAHVERVVHASALEHEGATLTRLWKAANAHPEEHIEGHAAVHVPQPTSDALEAPVMAEKSCLHASARRAPRLGSDHHRHLCRPGGAWIPSEWVLRRLAVVRGVCLRLEERAGVCARVQALLSAQRTGYRYMLWRPAFVLVAVAGCSPHMHERPLPVLTPWRGAQAEGPEMMARAADEGVATASSVHSAEDGATPRCWCPEKRCWPRIPPPRGNLAALHPVAGTLAAIVPQAEWPWSLTKALQGPEWSDVLMLRCALERYL